MNDITYTPDTDKAKEDFEIIQNEANYVTDTFMVDESSSWRTYKDNEYRDAIKRAVAGELPAKDALTDLPRRWQSPLSGVLLIKNGQPFC